MKSIGRDSMLEQAWDALAKLRAENKKLKARIIELNEQLEERNRTLDEVLGNV